MNGRLVVWSMVTKSSPGFELSHLILDWHKYWHHVYLHWKQFLLFFYFRTCIGFRSLFNKDKGELVFNMLVSWMFYDNFKEIEFRIRSDLTLFELLFILRLLLDTKMFNSILREILNRIFTLKNQLSSYNKSYIVIRKYFFLLFFTAIYSCYSCFWFTLKKIFKTSIKNSY